MKYKYLGYISSFFLILSVWLPQAVQIAYATPGATYYVSTTGDDSNPGTVSQPFLTLEKARDTIRTLKTTSGIPSGGVTVYLRGGVYKRTTTFTLTPQDSGSNGSPIVYQAYPGETPVISGETDVTGWTQLTSAPAGITSAATGHLWVANLTVGLRPHFLYVNGQNQQVARQFNTDQWRTWYKFSSGVGSVSSTGQKLTYSSTQDLSNLPSNGDMEMNLMPVQYWNTISNIQSVDTTAKSVMRLSKNVSTFWTNSFSDGNANLMNALPFLDTPGEWVVDSAAGKLYYWPQDDTMIGKTAIVPSLYELIRLQGDEEAQGWANQVQYVELHGLTLQYTDRMSEEQWPDEWLKRNAENPDATLFLQGVNHIVVEGNTIQNTGAYAIALDHYAQNVQVVHNELGNLGCGGVQIYGYGPGTTDLNKNNTVERNYIHDIGLAPYLHSAAITSFGSNNNTIQYNYMRNLPYAAVSIVGAPYGEVNARTSSGMDAYGSGIAMYNIRGAELPTTVDYWSVKNYLHSDHNLVQKNIVDEYMLLMGDGGALYSWSPGSYNQWKNNVIYKSQAANGMLFPLYMDDYTDYATLDGNVTWSAGSQLIKGTGTNSLTNDQLSYPAKPSGYDSLRSTIITEGNALGGWLGVAPGPINQPASPPLSMYGYWNFDETSGKAAADSTGNNTTASLVGGASWTTGKTNNGVLFNGYDSYVNINDTYNPSALTVALWVKPTSASAQNIFVKTNNTGATSNYSEQIRINSSGKFELYMYDGSTKTITGTTTVQANTWYQVALVATNNGQMKLYVNGQPEGTPVNIGIMATSGGRYWLGSNSAGGFGWFQGVADDVRLYNFAATDSDMSNLYNGGSVVIPSLPSTNMSGYWKLNETSGTSAADSSGNNKSGVLNGGTTWTTGKFNNGLSFNGTNSYVSISDSTSPTAYSLSLWVKPSVTTAQNLFARTNSSGAGSTYSHQLRINSSGKFEAYMWDGASKSVTGTTTVSANTWYHVALVSSNNGQMQLYVNGQPEGTPVSIGTMWTGGDRYWLGSNSGGGFGWFNGIADEVKQYNIALNNNDIFNQYHAIIGNWKLDETTGSSASDSSGNANVSTLNGGAAWSTGKVNNSVSLNGTNSYVNISDTASPTAFTASFWVKPTVTTAQSLFVRTNSSGAGSVYSHQLRINSSGKFEAYMWDGATKTVTGTTTVSANTWYHVALVAANNGQMKLYVNGQPEGTPVSIGTMWSAGDRYWVGSNSGGGFGWLNGKVDELKVFNTALSDSEVANQYQTFSDNFESDTVGANATGWNVVSGSWQVIAGNYYKAITPEVSTIAGSVWSDATVQAKVKVDTWNSTGYRGTGLLTRFQDNNNYYYFQYYNNDGKLYISKKVNGIWTHLGSTPFTFNTGQFYTFKVVLNGTNIKCFVDGTQIFNVTDSQYSSGKVGLAAVDNSATFDEVMIN